MAKSMSSKKSEVKTEDVNVKSAVEESKKVEKKVVEEKPKKTVRDFEPEQSIMCMSVTQGELIMPGIKSHLMYRWMGYGDVTEVEYQDLYAYKTRRSGYLYEPFLVIQDDELLETDQWKDVAAIYENMYSYQDINEILNMNNPNFASLITSAPKGLRKAVQIEIATRLEAGTFDSLQKIKIMDEICGTDLSCYIN